MDTLKKSLYKAISWRIIGTIPTFIISYILTGNYAIAGGMTVAEFFLKIALYMAHERVWAKINVS